MIMNRIRELRRSIVGAVSIGWLIGFVAVGDAAGATPAAFHSGSERETTALDFRYWSHSTDQSRLQASDPWRQLASDTIPTGPFNEPGTLAVIGAACAAGATGGVAVRLFKNILGWHGGEGTRYWVEGAVEGCANAVVLLAAKAVLGALAIQGASGLGGHVAFGTALNTWVHLRAGSVWSIWAEEVGGDALKNAAEAGVGVWTEFLVTKYAPFLFAAYHYTIGLVTEPVIDGIVLIIDGPQSPTEMGSLVAPRATSAMIGVLNGSVADAEASSGLNVETEFFGGSSDFSSSDWTYENMWLRSGFGLTSQGDYGGSTALVTPASSYVDLGVILPRGMSESRLTVSFRIFGGPAPIDVAINGRRVLDAWTASTESDSLVLDNPGLEPGSNSIRISLASGASGDFGVNVVSVVAEGHRLTRPLQSAPVLSASTSIVEPREEFALSWTAVPGASEYTLDRGAGWMPVTTTSTSATDWIGAAGDSRTYSCLLYTSGAADEN